MKVMVILAHPRTGSFNHVLAEALCRGLWGAGIGVTFHDLYREGFDPVLPAGELSKMGDVEPAVLAHCDELSHCGGLVFVHPNWWGAPPAILKGWIDRVVRPGIAYEFLEGDAGEGVPRGLLAGKSAAVFNTSDTPEEREREVFGDPLERFWRDCVFGFCGITRYHRRTFRVMVTSTEKQRGEWLREAEEFAGGFFSA
ncbi:MAG: NAD(P)H-dependent oxidoreductase [Spirochaetes bacterium]|nr:NAD(P)H-dependent oxidoreductase [Spirochaetota bacterium]